MTNRNKHDLFEIGGQIVAPGNIGDIAIPISDLSAGMQANMVVRVFHGKRTGPTIFVSAAIHGDEIIGTEIIRRLMKKLHPARMAGTVIFVPVVNMFGFITHSRYLPDRRDLNRSFPGTEKGSLAPPSIATICPRSVSLPAIPSSRSWRSISGHRSSSKRNCAQGRCALWPGKPVSTCC